ncbi:hypothetical protein [Planctomicrobium sp. SH664]|uniref:hypothetical protein n=1 Tax=Planctomicrobium sp. SH664 TaxID=3448125 RepID=UPI003F5C458C
MMNENDPLHFDSFRIRLRPLLRYLGVTLGVVASAPTVLGILFFLLNPSELVRDPLSFLMCVAIAAPIVYGTFRWVTIQGVVTSDSILIRGWFKTVVVDPSRIIWIRKVKKQVKQEHRTRNEWEYRLCDQKGRTLATVPAAIHASPGWEQFLQLMQRLASVNRIRENVTAADGHLLDIPVDEWTLQDLEKYERES